MEDRNKGRELAWKFEWVKDDEVKEKREKEAKALLQNLTKKDATGIVLSTGDYSSQRERERKEVERIGGRELEMNDDLPPVNDFQNFDRGDEE